MRVNTQSGSAYDQVGSASTANNSDPTQTGSAADQKSDVPSPTELLQAGVPLPTNIQPDAIWTRLQGVEKQVHQIEQTQREGRAF